MSSDDGYLPRMVKRPSKNLEPARRDRLRRLAESRFDLTNQELASLRSSRTAADLAAPCGCRYPASMTVKERLHQVVEQMTDEEAEATLRRIDVLRNDPLVRFLDAAPVDDEPTTLDEQQALADVAADRAAAVPTISFDEIKRKYA